MKSLILKLILLISFFGVNIYARDVTNYQWANLHLYKGVNQRGGPFAFDDTYVELEFGGRYEWLDLYGYIDFLDVLNSRSSDKHGDNNFFADIEPRISIDYLLNKDLSYGALKELYFAFDIYYADPTPGEDKGLKVIWMGLGSDIEIPWLGKSGVNFYTRFIEENYGASNEHSFDGYVAHINWFKPIYNFTDTRFLAFQGYIDYEFNSKLNDNDFEKEYRTSDSFQSYLGLWLHDKKWALGYGLKAYKNMTQWKDGETLNDKKTDTTGFAHYFNVAYKF
ncbi:MAG: outer membrane protein OmpK [Arcobacteraceae bacterium]